MKICSFLCIFVYFLSIEIKSYASELDTTLNDENLHLIQTSSQHNDVQILRDIANICENLKKNNHLKSNDPIIISLRDQLDKYSKDGVSEASFLMAKYYMGGILPFTLSFNTSLLSTGSINPSIGLIRNQEVNRIIAEDEPTKPSHFKKDDWLLDLVYRTPEDYSLDSGYKGYDYLYNSPLDIQKCIQYLLMASQNGHPQSISLLSVLSQIALRIPPNDLRQFYDGKQLYKREDKSNEITDSILRRNYHELHPTSRIWNEMSSANLYPSSNILLGYNYASYSRKDTCLKSLKNYEIASDSFFNYQDETPPMPKLSFGDDSIDLEDNYNNENPKTHVDVVDFIKYQADVGEQKFQKTAGLIYLIGGQGIARDYEKALMYLKACYKNDAGSKGLYAYMLQNGLGVEVNYPRAIALYNESANHGNGFSAMQLGLIYLRGWHVEKNITTAMSYFTKGSDMLTERYTFLAEIFLTELTDYNKANMILMTAKNTRYPHPKLLYYLSKVEKFNDCESKIKNYQELIKETYFKPIQRRAYHYYTDNKYEHSLLLYDILASLGDVLSQKNAAWMYYKGLGLYDLKISSFFPEQSETEENLDKDKHRIELYRMAASQKSAKANLKLGDIYYYGLGVEKNLEVSAAHYWIATDLKSPQAAFNFGYMYQKGEGVPKNITLARRHYELAMSYNKDAYIPAKLALFSIYFETQFEIIKDFSALIGTISLLFIVILIRRSYG